jgi:predicted PurR-regulated permease PerM
VWGVRRLVAANLAVLSVAACFLAVYRFAAALFILFVGIALGMAVKPGVDWLRRRGVPRWLGALAVYLCLGAAAAGVLLLAVPVIAQEVGALVARGPHRFEQLRDGLLSSSSRTIRRLAAFLPRAIDGAPDAAGAVAPSTGTLLASAGALGRNAFTVAAVLLLGYYWTLEGDRRVRALVFFVPLEQRRALHGFLADVERKVGAYVRGQALVCGVVGVGAIAIYRLMGLPHAGTLGLVYAIAEAVPIVGPIVGAAAAALVGLSVSPALALWTIAAAAGLQLVEAYVIVPRVMDRTVGTSPLVTLLAISAFGSVLGIAGAVLAIPLAAIVQLLLDRFLLGVRARAWPAPGGRDRISVVRYEVQELALDVRKRQRGPGVSPAGAERLEDAVEGIAADLDRVLAAPDEGEAEGER